MKHSNLVWLMVLSAVGWGLWWVPIRVLHNLGMNEIWAGVLPIGVGALGVMGVLFWRRLNPLNLPPAAITGGVLFGVAISLYGVALGLTDVVRAALFFYLAPIWALLIEIFWLRLRLTWHGPVAATICLLGLLTLFQFQIDLSVLNIGDLVALGSGLCFSIASTCIYLSADKMPMQSPLMRITGLMLITGALVSLALIWWFDTPIGTVTQAGWAALIVLATGVLLLAPVSYIMQMGAERLSPATLALLYIGEIATSVVTAALFLPSEQFGWFEAIGAGLIAGAGLIQATKGEDPKTSSS